MIERTALLVAVVTAMAWGLTGIFVQLLPPLSPLAIAAGRLGISCVVVLPWLLFGHAARQNLLATLTRPVLYLLAGLLVGYYILATAAFQRAPVAEVALLLSLPPLFVLLLRRLQGESVSAMEAGGALLALAGVILILAPYLMLDSFFASAAVGAHLMGDLLALAASLLMALYARLSQLLSARGMAPEPRSVAWLAFALGALLAGLLLAITVATTVATTDATTVATTPTSIAGQLTANSLLLLLGLGVVSTAIPTLGYALVSRRLPAILTASIALFIPLFAGLFAYLILDERLSGWFIAGCVLVLFGVALMLRAVARRRGASTEAME